MKMSFNVYGNISGNQGIYLAKSGKIYGPFSADELDQMGMDGRLSSFFWIWNHQESKWSPIELPPDCNPMDAGPIGAGKDEAGGETGEIEAICYDRFKIMQGRIASMTQSGCLLVCSSFNQGAAVFPRHGVFLSLVKGKEKRCKTKAVEVVKQNGREFWLRWV